MAVFNDSGYSAITNNDSYGWINTSPYYVYYNNLHNIDLYKLVVLDGENCENIVTPAFTRTYCIERYNRRYERTTITA